MAFISICGFELCKMLNYNINNTITTYKIYYIKYMITYLIPYNNLNIKFIKNVN